MRHMVEYKQKTNEKKSSVQKYNHKPQAIDKKQQQLKSVNMHYPEYYNHQTHKAIAYAEIR